MKTINYILDFYLKVSLLLDFLICASIWIIGVNYNPIYFQLQDKQNQLTILASLISGGISLAGFVLAALTIIVTFKSNIQSKPLQNSNGLELLFSSVHYPKVVSTFKKALIEFVFCFVVLYCVWIVSDSLGITQLNLWNIVGLTATTLALVRTLSVLFVILTLEEIKGKK